MSGRAAAGMRRPADDAADAHRADLLRLERIRDVELLQLARAPAGDIEELIVDAQLDVGDQRRHRLEWLEGRWQLVLLRRLGRDGDDLVASQPSFAPLAPSLRRQRKM